MRKNELVHLHALVRTVADHLIDRGSLDPAALADYEALGVSPMALQASRGDHERAVLVLATAVADAIREPEGAVPRAADAPDVVDRRGDEPDRDTAPGRVVDLSDDPTG